MSKIGLAPSSASLWLEPKGPKIKLLWAPFCAEAFPAWVLPGNFLRCIAAHRYNSAHTLHCLACSSVSQCLRRLLSNHCCTGRSGFSFNCVVLVPGVDVGATVVVGWGGHNRSGVLIVVSAAPLHSLAFSIVHQPDR